MILSGQCSSLKIAGEQHQGSLRLAISYNVSRENVSVIENAQENSLSLTFSPRFHLGTKHSTVVLNTHQFFFLSKVIVETNNTFLTLSNLPIRDEFALIVPGGRNQIFLNQPHIIPNFLCSITGVRNTVNSKNNIKTDRLQVQIDGSNSTIEKLCSVCLGDSVVVNMGNKCSVALSIPFFCHERSITFHKNPSPQTAITVYCEGETIGRYVVGEYEKWNFFETLNSIETTQKPHAESMDGVVESETSVSLLGNCCVCYSSNCSILIFPCNHICTCELCFEKLAKKACPYCGGGITSATRVYMVGTESTPG